MGKSVTKGQIEILINLYDRKNYPLENLIKEFDTMSFEQAKKRIEWIKKQPKISLQ